MIAYLADNQVSAHRIAIRFDIDAGLELGRITSDSHPIVIKRDGKTHATVSLRDAEAYPNKDFVLRYRIPEDKLDGAIATHRVGDEQYFCMITQPPSDPETRDERPREIIFVVDCSGSMLGSPLEICKQSIRTCLRRLSPRDRFQIIRFSNTHSELAARPLPANRSNIERGLDYLDKLQATGGTMMIKGIRAALHRDDADDRRRIIVFMTDGFIGNEREILGAVHRDIGDSRIFSFGVGASPNRYLLERMAALGRGIATYVKDGESSNREIDQLFQRFERPILSDLSLDLGTEQALELYPSRLPDVFDGRPLLIVGKYHGSKLPTEARLMGKTGGRQLILDLQLAAGTQHLAVQKLWARAKIRELEDRSNWVATPSELDSIIKTSALNNNLLSAYTSFIAVDGSETTAGDHGVTVKVAIPVPAGTSYDTNH